MMKTTDVILAPNLAPDAAAKKLTDADLQTVLGDALPNMIIFSNYDFAARGPGYNVDTYNGHAVDGADFMSAHFRQMSDALAGCGWFAPRQLLALVSKTIDGAVWSEFGAVVHNPKYVPGVYVANNMVTYDPRDGRVSSVNGGWISMARMTDISRVATHGQYAFPYFFVRRNDIRWLVSQNMR